MTVISTELFGLRSCALSSESSLWPAAFCSAGFSFCEAVCSDVLAFAFAFLAPAFVAVFLALVFLAAPVPAFFLALVCFLAGAASSAGLCASTLSVVSAGLSSCGAVSALAAFALVRLRGFFAFCSLASASGLSCGVASDSDFASVSVVSASDGLCAVNSVLSSLPRFLRRLLHAGLCASLSCSSSSSDLRSLRQAVPVSAAALILVTG